MVKGKIIKIKYLSFAIGLIASNGLIYYSIIYSFVK